MTHMDGQHGGRGPGGPGAGGPGLGGPGRISQADRSQLAEHPADLRRIAALFAPHKGAIAVVVLLIAVSSVVSLAQPFLVRAAIDEALPQHNVQLLAALAGGMVAVAAATAVIGVLQTWIATTMGQRVMHTLRTGLFTHLQRQSLAFFTRTRGGEVQSRLTNDINGMQSVVTTSATAVAANLTTAVATAVAMVALSPGLSVLSLLVIPPAVWLSRRVALLRRDITTVKQRELATLHTQVEEGLSVSGVRLAKTLGTGPREAARFAATSEKLTGLEVRSQLAGRWRMATMQVVFAAIPALVYLSAGFPALTGDLSIGTLVAFTALQGTIFRPIMGLLNVGVQWVTALALFSRIFEYQDLVPDIVPPARPVAVDPATARGELSFAAVRFAYDADAPEGGQRAGGADAAGERGGGADAAGVRRRRRIGRESGGSGRDSGGGAPREVLRGIELTVPAGTTTAIVGATGSGKSTLGSLVPRLFDATAGQVAVDGIDVRDYDPEDLARIVGVVSQETYLVHASVRENLLLANPRASDAQLWEALAAARIADLVAGLPDGLDTVVGARGHRFSGGEQQRIAIARTMLRNPKVLVLDEATSALDNTTEAEVQAALDRLSAGRTTLTIAHRLSTVANADQVVVLDAGRIVERGTPAELLAAGGAYARLAASRSAEEHAAARGEVA